MDIRDRERRDLATHDERIQTEARAAAAYMRDNPGMSRDEALRLAAASIRRNGDVGDSVPYVEVDRETAYGSTVRLSRSIRVF